MIFSDRSPDGGCGNHRAWVTAQLLRISIVLLLFGVSASAQHSNFSLATSGCGMAHCSNFAGGQDPAAPPAQLPTKQTNDFDTGQSPGLGCVSNGTFVACTYKTGPPVTCPA